MLALGPLEIVLLLVVLIVFFGWHRSGRLFGKIGVAVMNIAPPVAMISLL